jgi:hypothetical protein
MGFVCVQHYVEQETLYSFFFVYFFSFFLSFYTFFSLFSLLSHQLQLTHHAHVEQALPTRPIIDNKLMNETTTRLIRSERRRYTEEINETKMLQTKECIHTIPTTEKKGKKKNKLMNNNHVSITLDPFIHSQHMEREKKK